MFVCKQSSREQRQFENDSLEKESYQDAKVKERNNLKAKNYLKFKVLIDVLLILLSLFLLKRLIHKEKVQNKSKRKRRSSFFSNSSLNLFILFEETS